VVRSPAARATAHVTGSRDPRASPQVARYFRALLARLSPAFHPQRAAVFAHPRARARDASTNREQRDIHHFARALSYPPS
jgi:hypothetical protein